MLTSFEKPHNINVDANESSHDAADIFSSCEAPIQALRIEDVRAQGCAMKLSIATTAFVFVLLNLSVQGASAQAAPTAQGSQVEIAYVPPRDRALQPTYARLRDRKVLEELKQFLTPLRLPKKLTVQVDQCGASRRPYTSGGPVTICYELVRQIEEVAQKTDQKLRASVVAGTFIQVTLHEVAFALLDMLQFPVWGRMGDAADRLAAFVMVNFGEDLAIHTIRATAIFFDLSKKTWTGSAFADIASPEEQRFYNYLCVAFGSSPISFNFLVAADANEEPVLPSRRARKCKGEYEQIRQAFNLRIMPFVDADMLVAVRSAQWLLPADVK